LGAWTTRQRKRLADSRSEGEGKNREAAIKEAGKSQQVRATMAFRVRVVYVISGAWGGKKEKEKKRKKKGERRLNWQ
jgi:hypothetical protein